MLNEQEIRCAEIIGEAEKLAGDNAFDTIDMIMGCSEWDLRKIVSYMQWLMTKHRQQLNIVELITRKLLKEVKDDAAQDNSELVERIASLERGFSVLRDEIGKKAQNNE